MVRSGAEAAAEAPRGGLGGAKPPPRIFLQFWQCVLTFQVKCGAKANFKIIETLAPTWGFCVLIRVLMCYHLCKVGELVVLQKACVNNLWKLVC